jgi:hypothetical protein
VASDGEPDPDNPYDYRHHLNHAPRAASRSPSPGLRAASTINTPVTTSTRAKPTAETKVRSRPASKVDPLRPAPRKAVKKAPARPTPTVRLDRRASTRPGDGSDKQGPKLSKASSKPSIKSDYYVHSSGDEKEPAAQQNTTVDQTSLSDEEDDEEIGTQGGGLEIDFGDSPPPKRKTRALALSGALHGGPISLHSATNSPNSRIVVPREQRNNRKDEDEIDFGESSAGYDEDEEESDVDALPAARRKDGDLDVTMDDASDEERDEDVEPMSLGSPAHQQTAVDEDADADADADADLDAEFEAEMMQGLANPSDSEEESEAE